MARLPASHPPTAAPRRHPVADHPVAGPLVAPVAAPPAAASTLAGALNWTGIADSHGVPAGDLYLSVVSTSEAITEARPGLNANPTSWARWLGHAVTTGVSHQIIIELLQPKPRASSS
jgi:hypothetical protein